MRFRSFFVALLLTTSVFFGFHVRAISVNPAIIEVSADVGTQKDFSIVVSNDESKPMTYALTIQKFLSEGEGGGVRFLSSSDTSGLPDWLYLDAPTITLRPGETKKLPVSLRVPDDASSGGHFAAIFLTQTTIDSVVGNNVSAIPRIGILVFATVNGNLNERMSLQSARVEQVSQGSSPVRFIEDVQNQGNVHVRPDIQIDLTNMFGRNVATIDGNMTKGRILPGSNRLYTSDWNDGGFGWYQAHIRVAGRVGAVGESTVSFQIWPWKMMLLVFGGFISFVILLLFGRRALRQLG